MLFVLYVFAFIVLILIFVKLYLDWRVKIFKYDGDLTGKTVIITGATSG